MSLRTALKDFFQVVGRMFGPPPCYSPPGPPPDPRVPEQTLNFLDGSKVVIGDCPLIMQAKWTPAPDPGRPRFRPPPGQEGCEFNKYGVNVTWVDIEARKKADQMLVDCYANPEHRDTPAARERWHRTWWQAFRAMAEP